MYKNCNREGGGHFSIILLSIGQGGGSPMDSPLARGGHPPPDLGGAKRGEGGVLPFVV